MLLKRSMAAIPALACGLAVSTFTGGVGLADTVRLENGDTLSGHVSELTEKQLKLKSEVLGDVTLERSKVAEIYLGDNKPQEAVATAVPAPPKSESQTQAKPTAPFSVPGLETTPQQQNLNDILGQLQNDGVSADTMGELTQQFPLLADPNVSKMFRDRVGGLMSGRLDIQDIRKDAVDALDMIEELEEELGPTGAQALQGYKGILQNFVNRSAPVKPITGDEAANGGDLKNSESKDAK